MINPSDLRHLVNNDKIAFAGKFYNFDEITEDEAVLKVFLEATESLVDSDQAPMINEFADNLKVKLENFSLTHDYSDLSGRVNELVYKISFVQKSLTEKAVPLDPFLEKKKRIYHISFSSRFW